MRLFLVHFLSFSMWHFAYYCSVYASNTSNSHWYRIRSIWLGSANELLLHLRIKSWSQQDIDFRPTFNAPSALFHLSNNKTREKMHENAIIHSKFIYFARLKFKWTKKVIVAVVVAVKMYISRVWLKFRRIGAVHKSPNQPIGNYYECFVAMPKR